MVSLDRGAQLDVGFPRSSQGFDFAEDVGMARGAISVECICGDELGEEVDVEVLGLVVVFVVVVASYVAVCYAAV